ncbi:hypothetical protein C9374_001976 [Naegleria lovaniensis]|uniref:Uncharacterized protein n=1 Tax=Naegleria lovaniensis TaxID=51637 RepID=A0AA88GR89_NAELO|nr:uncharacterized protein C9374_001976 [Naegleria lovaniensis]KAG2386941.1 hypothetical protein C9374_001976 [Naegleria lovaniensis]
MNPTIMNNLYELCEYFIGIVEPIRNDYIHLKRIQFEDLSNYTCQLDSIALFIGFTMCHFHIKRKALIDPYVSLFTSLPYLKKVKETLLLPYNLTQLVQEHHIPIRSHRVLKQLESYKNNKFIYEFYQATYGYSIMMDIIRVTEFELMDEDFLNGILFSLKLCPWMDSNVEEGGHGGHHDSRGNTHNSHGDQSHAKTGCKEFHVWIDLRRVKNEKLLLENLKCLLSHLNDSSTPRLLYLDINYYESEEQLYQYIQVLNHSFTRCCRKRHWNHVILSYYYSTTDTLSNSTITTTTISTTISTTTTTTTTLDRKQTLSRHVDSSKREVMNIPSDSQQNSHFSFTHHIHHLTLLDKNNYNILNRIIYKNTCPYSSSKLYHLTISNIDHLHLFLNNHLNIKRIDFFSQNGPYSDNFNDTNLLKSSFEKLMRLSTIYIDDRNETLGYSILGNIGIYVNNVIFKYSRNGYTLSSLIECVKRYSRRLTKLTLIDNTTPTTDLPLLSKLISSYLFDNMIEQLIIYTKSISLLSEMSNSIQQVFSANELELKYLQINRKSQSVDFVIFLGRMNGVNHHMLSGGHSAATTTTASGSTGGIHTLGGNVHHHHYSTTTGTSITPPTTSMTSISIIHTIPISGEYEIIEELMIEKRHDIDAVMNNVCLFGSNVVLMNGSQNSSEGNVNAPLAANRCTYNHYTLYRFLNALSLSNSLTLTRPFLAQLMVIK